MSVPLLGVLENNWSVRLYFIPEVLPMRSSILPPGAGLYPAVKRSYQLDPAKRSSPKITPKQQENDASVPLFVDLDGTLTASDLLADAIVRLIKHNPLSVFNLISWLTCGRACLKRRLAQLVTPDVEGLPYRSEVLNFLKEEKDRSGRPVILATASDEIWGRKVAAELSIFDDVIGSDGLLNLKGQVKVEAIQRYCQEHGFSGFDYIGDSSCDIPIWKASKTAIAVEGCNGTIRVLDFSERSNFHANRIPPLGVILRAMRPHQWIKNLLLFVPLTMAHQLTELPKLFSCIIGVIAFSLCASSIYIINDLLDIEADRLHPKKCQRPFASGKLPLVFGPPLALCLATVGLSISIIWLPGGFLAVLIGYLFATTMYSFWLKSKVMIDVVVLAMLYASRVLAGSVAADVLISEWMLTFSIFIFTSLAFAKRYSEQRRLMETSGIEKKHGRGYRLADVQMLSTMGPSSGYMAVLVLALYMNSDEVRVEYSQPSLLWLLCPLMLYWIGRLWIMAGRGKLPDDPVAFTVTDRMSWGVAVLSIIILLAASW